MLRFTRKRVAALALATSTVVGTGCINTNILLDHAWFDNPSSGSTPSTSSLHIYDADGSHTEPCVYGTDFGCQPGNVRPVNDPVGPNGEDNRQGRAAIWSNISAADTPCTHQDANGQPGHGWPGYGGFTPPSDNCVAYMQGRITDDPNDSASDEPMWNICAYETAGSPPTTASGYNPRACQNGGPGAKYTGGTTNVNTWVQAQFVGAKPSQGWTNTVELIIDARDFYAVMIHDSQISGFQADGYPGCISIYDFGSNPRVRLQRLCP